MRRSIREQCPWLLPPRRNHGQKGDQMIAYHNQPIGDFINQLRDIADNAKARPSVIDQIEALHAIGDLEAELEEAQKAQGEAEDNRDDLREELEALCDAVQAQSDLDPTSMSEALLAALKLADKALERHK